MRKRVEAVDEADAFAFDPVPLRARLDGWTAERQVAFIRALAESACVAEACRAVKMSKRSAYMLRARPEAICRAAPGPYAIATVPLLTEGGGRASYPWLHRILVVDTPAAVQKARLMQRDGIDATLADQMMAAQASRAERLALADDIVVNDGDLAHLQRAADQLHARYVALASSTP